MLQVSSCTVKRRFHNFRIKLSGKFSIILDEELDREVELILVQFLNPGYKRLRVYLLLNVYNMQEYRACELGGRFAPEGVNPALLLDKNIN